MPTEHMATGNNQSVRLLSRREVASELRVTVRTVNNWSRQGILRPVRLPNRKHALGYRPGDIARILS